MARPIVALPPTEREELQRYLTQRKLLTDLKLRIQITLPEDHLSSVHTRSEHKLC